MKVSLNLAQSVSNVDLKSLPKDELLKKIGLQLGAVEEVIDYGVRFDRVVVSRVVSCEDHPNADRLHVCRIDDGGVSENVNRDEDGYVQVVCGAPNVREGLLVAWLPPGSTVPVSYDEKEPFVLDARELRGVMSNGMLASSKELGLSNDHAGILEIEEDVAPGKPLVSLYGLDDVIIDCENKMFTHRPDCFGILGVARELAGIQHQQFTSPDWYTQAPHFTEQGDLPLGARIETELVSRFMAVALDNVTVGSSPVWLQSALARVGIKSINNVVDVTNYVMHLTAQPLHAYDYDKVAARSESTPTLVARTARVDETVALLNAKTVALDDSTVVISTDKEAVGVAGVMGGSDTEVDETTKRIILEVATFDMYSIRRTSMKYGLFTDAVTRFNKGQSPLQNDRVLAYAARLLGELTGAVLASAVQDEKGYLEPPKQVTIDAQFINERLGSKLSATEISQLLSNVEFQVEVSGENLVITAPFWRQDIELKEDIVEEVGRLYGFDQLPVSLPRRQVDPVDLDPLLKFKQKIRTVMAAGGANEVLSYNFVHGNLLQKVGQDPADAYKIRNALSPDLQYYRLSVVPSLLTFVHPNLKAGHDEFMIYELGKAHDKKHVDKDNLPLEFHIFAGVYAAKSSKTPSYYHARRYLDYVAEQFGLTFTYTPITEATEHATTQPYDLTRSAYVGVKGHEISLGIIGELRAEVRKGLKLPDSVAAFEIDTEVLQKAANIQKPYQPLSRYPGTSQDICFRVEEGMAYAELEGVILTALSNVPIDTAVELVDIYKADGSDAKQVTFRISMVDQARTLSGEEANQVIKEVTDFVTNELAATVV